MEEAASSEGIGVDEREESICEAGEKGRLVKAVEKS